MASTFPPTPTPVPLLLLSLPPGNTLSRDSNLVFGTGWSSSSSSSSFSSSSVGLPLPRGGFLWPYLCSREKLELSPSIGISQGAFTATHSGPAPGPFDQNLWDGAFTMLPGLSPRAWWQEARGLGWDPSTAGSQHYAFVHDPKPLYLSFLVCSVGIKMPVLDCPGVGWRPCVPKWTVSQVCRGAWYTFDGGVKGSRWERAPRRTREEGQVSPLIMRAIAVQFPRVSESSFTFIKNINKYRACQTGPVRVLGKSWQPSGAAAERGRGSRRGVGAGGKMTIPAVPPGSPWQTHSPLVL